MTSSTEEQLEAAIWDALRRHKATSQHAGELVDDLLIAAKLYAAGDSDELTALRRQVLERDTAGIPRAGQTSPSTAGEPAGGTGARPLEGSASLGQPMAGGGATLSTRQPIPGPSTSGNAGLSTCGQKLSTARAEPPSGTLWAARWPAATNSRTARRPGCWRN